jgi:hypothetical protein
MNNVTLTDARAPIRPLVSLADAQLRLDPGQIGQSEFTVRNPGNIIETYDLTILGPAQAWADINPDFVSLFPGEEDTVTLELHPPMTHRVPAGVYAVGVMARSQVRPEATSTAEMLVTVNPFYRFRCTSAATSFTIRTRATMLVQIINEGNSTVTYELKAFDPEGFMRVRAKESMVTLAPGESRWVDILISVAPKFIGSDFNTRSFNVSVTPIRDEDLDLAILDEDSEEVIGSVLQRPYIRLRLGVFGRLLIVLTILGLVAGFFISRWVQQQIAPIQGAPRVPVEFVAKQGSIPNQVLLTWQPSSGATEYRIYAVGSAGNPQPAPAPTVIVELPSVGGGGGVTRSAPIRRETELTEPSEPTEAELASPVCESCTEVAVLGQGVTRHVVADVPVGKACYRIAAFVGTLQSLFSKPQCSDVVEASQFDGNSDGIPDVEQAADGADGAGGEAEDTPPRPCPAIDVDARPVSTTSVAVLWKKATKPPAGFTAPTPEPATAVEGAQMDAAQLDAAQMEVRGGSPSGTDPGTDSGKPDSGKPDSGKPESGKPAGSGSKKRVCDPEQEVTAWNLQRRIFTGWSDVSPAPTADDTAVEVRDLASDTRYCFRIRAVSEQGTSRWSDRVCVRTDPEPITEPTPVVETPMDAAIVRELPY